MHMCCDAQRGNSPVPDSSLLPILARTKPTIEVACWMSPLGQYSDVKCIAAPSV